MAAFLPLLQMRAHMMAGSGGDPQPRAPLSSSGASTDCSSSPPTPTPISPLLAAQYQQNQMYLNSVSQLAAINLHLQQKRLLDSQEDVKNPAATANLKLGDQDEPMDLSRAPSVLNCDQKEPQIIWA